MSVGIGVGIASIGNTNLASGLDFVSHARVWEILHAGAHLVCLARLRDRHRPPWREHLWLFLARLHRLQEHDTKGDVSQPLHHGNV